MTTRHHRERGGVLISITFLLIILGVYLSRQLQSTQLEVTQWTQQLSRQQAYRLAESGIEWSRFRGRASGNPRRMRRGTFQTSLVGTTLTSVGRYGNAEVTLSAELNITAAPSTLTLVGSDASFQARNYTIEPLTIQGVTLDLPLSASVGEIRLRPQGASTDLVLTGPFSDEATAALAPTEVFTVDRGDDLQITLAQLTLPSGLSVVDLGLTWETALGPVTPTRITWEVP